MSQPTPANKDPPLGQQSPENKTTETRPRMFEKFQPQHNFGLAKGDNCQNPR